jgi:hypothetical protein
MFDTLEGAKNVMGKIREAVNESQIDDLIRFFGGGAIMQDEVLQFLNKNSGGEYFLKGYTIPIPLDLVTKMNEFSKAGLPVEGLINFWMLCMDNPNPVARQDLFKFANQYNFPITPYGYFVGYKSVYQTGLTPGFISEELLDEIVSAPVLGTGKTFKELVEIPESKALLLESYQLLCGQPLGEDGEYGENVYFFAPSHIEEIDEYLHNNKNKDKNFSELHYIFVMEAYETEYDNPYSVKQVVDQYLTVEGADDSDVTFTDIHTRTFKIKLGEVVKMPREDCDSDPDRTCSSGLHIGAPGYVKDFGYGDTRKIIACLVNPAHVVAVPKDYSFMKMRVCEYFPYAISDFDKAENLQEIDTQFYEADYLGYEKAELEERLKKFEIESSWNKEAAADSIQVVRERLTIINL